MTSIIITRVILTDHILPGYNFSLLSMAVNSMTITSQPTWIAFAGNKRIASGPARDVTTKVKTFVDTDNRQSILIFDATSSQPIELDLRGSLTTVLKRLAITYPHTSAADSEEEAEIAEAPRTAGRPKLGVTAREVTLLPRHWDWLAAQTGGASVALRKLVEHALRASKEDDRIRQAREAAYKFMTAIAGNQPAFEDTTRALFAGDIDTFQTSLAKWPADIRKHALALAAASSAQSSEINHA
ncbi:MAG: uncharacterized protein JWM78_282 [Verrucomicrobiaceae bacterium]|nr:uncharacterized protein [Verrucomicrobiaceae bacterium]